MSGPDVRPAEDPGRRSAGSDATRFASRRTAPRSRKRLLLRSAVAVCVVAALAGGAIWLSTSDMFRVVRVESGSYRFTDEEELQAVLSGFLGRNLWTLSNDEVAAALADLPWVRDVRVRRRLPALLVVDFREWRPLLEVAGEGNEAGAGARVLVADGRVLPFPAHLVLAGLPVLTGVACEIDTTGATVLAAPQAESLLALLEAVEESGLESVCPVDFVVARPEGFAIVLQGDLGRLLVGREEFRERLDRYMEAHEHLESGLIVDLRFRDRVTCRRPED